MVSGFRRAALLCTAMAALALPSSALAAPAPAGWWKLDDGSGTTAADAAGAHPATLRGGAGWTAGIVGPSALSTNGSTAFADTGDPVIDTSHSFSVSAWVRLTRISGFQTVLSVDGTQVSGFYFGLRDDTRRFAFVKLPSDVPQGGVIVSGTFDPVPNRWYLLTGVFDATANTMSLYVDGRLQGTSPAPATAWRAAGTLAIGRAKYNGGNVDFVSGAIDDARVWQDVLTPDDVAQLADAGSWRLDEGAGTTAADASGNHNDLTLNAGASWTQGVVGSSALLFNGTNGAAEAPGPVLDTSQGFSVAAWVRSDSATGFRTAVSVDGQQISAFFLQQRNDNHFAFTRIATDAPGAGVAAVQTATIRQGQWYHLVGVYDSAANSLALYVNGTLQAVVPAPPGWKATGHLVVGRGKYAGAPTDYFSGAVDDVRTFSFPIGAAAASALATSGAWHFDEGAGTVARDDSPSHANGTLTNASWTTGAAGQAVAFTGDGKVDMGDAPSLDLGTGSLSLSAWFKTTAASGTILDKGAYRLSLDGGRVRARVGTIDVATTAAGYADGFFHPAVLTLDRGTQRAMLYVDGEPAEITSSGCGTLAGATAVDVSGCASNADSDQPFVVGAGFTGAIDEVLIDRFALSAEQVAQQAGFGQITVDATDVRAATRPTEYGSILEDISHSVEGGLYAELVRNRTLKESGSGTVPFWTLIQGGGATGSFGIDTTTPLNSALDRSLKLHVTALDAGGRIAAANAGFYGIDVKPSTTYTGSLWAKGTAGRLRVSLEKPDGTVLASTPVGGVTTGWQRYTYTLDTPANLAEATDNRVVVSLESDTPLANQDVWLTEVSLFPPTYKNHGLRIDLMEKLAALHLGLFRIPGGNYLEGNTLATRFAWKTTIGPTWERPGHQNTAWGYWSTDGMGILEYLRMAEDLGAQPLLAVFAGYTLNGQHVSEADYGQYIQEALDEIEYAIGDASTTWGARRIADGHPAPFDLHYIEVGNEDWFDGSGSYAWRFTRMYEAIKARYPQLKVISTTGGYQGGAASSTSPGMVPEVADDHFYQPPSWFNDNSTLYDRVDRSGPRILVGEYGAQDGQPTGTLRAAVGEAAFMTGLERNADVVLGGMFAPVLVNENAVNWPTNLIGLDARGSYGSPSYWAERIFAENTGRNVVGSTLTGNGGLKQVVTRTTEGGRTTLYVKVVNYSPLQQTARINFVGVSRFDEGTQTTLTGDPGARNTLADPTAIVPASRALSNPGLNSRYTFPGFSVNVIKLVGALGTPGVPPTSVSVDADVAGTVPATLALSIAGPVSFGAFTPGVAKDYTAQTSATVTSSAGNAALTVSDPGHLMNGDYALPQPLRVEFSKASWTGPVSNDLVALIFRQSIGAGDALRSGSYSRTLTFTLSSTTP